MEKKPLKKTGDYKVKINPSLIKDHEEAVKEGYKGDVKEYYEEFYGREASGMKKGGMTKGQKKISKVMREFKANKLKSSSGQKVTNPKQAIAIALSEAGQSKKMKKAASGAFITKGGDYIKDLL